MVTFQNPLYPLYYLDSDTVAQTNQYISVWEGEPTWQIVYISDFDNLVEAFQPIGVGAKTNCSCQSVKSGGGKKLCAPSTHGGCSPCDFHPCSGWENIKTWIAEVFD
jgi:hypothetical protein